jgi:hypothetical protein
MSSLEKIMHPHVPITDINSQTWMLPGGSGPKSALFDAPVQAPIPKDTQNKSLSAKQKFFKKNKNNNNNCNNSHIEVSMHVLMVVNPSSGSHHTLVIDRAVVLVTKDPIVAI